MVAIDLIVQHVHSQLEEVRNFTNTNLVTSTFIHTLVHIKKHFNTLGIIMFVATTSSLAPSSVKKLYNTDFFQEPNFSVNITEILI